MPRPATGCAWDVILTFHRVLPDGEVTRFHDVARSRFEEQLRTILSHTCISPGGGLTLRSGGRLCLTFDDGTADHEWVGERLAREGIAALFFVVTGRLDRPGHLTREAARRLVAAGHRLGSHTVTHRPLTSLEETALEEELVRSRADLESLSGSTVDWIAPPGGDLDKRAFARARQAGYRVVRTMRWGYAASPPEGEVSCFPINVRDGAERVDRILAGRGHLWPYRAKEMARAVVGERVYLAVRDGWFRWSKRSPGSEGPGPERGPRRPRARA